MLFQNILAQSSNQSGSLSWLWILLALVLVILVARAIFASTNKTESAPQITEEIEEETKKEVVEEVEKEVIPQDPDDLTKIEGIGPKTSSVFQAAGITTFAQLGGTEVEKLQAILDEAGLRLGDPSTWAEQAQLAATGEWDALEKLQDELKGGKRA